MPLYVPYRSNPLGSVSNGVSFLTHKFLMKTCFSEKVLWELNWVFFAVTMKSFSHELSSVSSNPIFSTVVCLYALILLYFPHLFLKIVFSPVLNATGILLFALLRLGAIQRLENEVNGNKETEEIDSREPGKPDFLDEDYKWVTSHSETDSETETFFDPTPCFEVSFVEWDVRAPLEVIYEEYEGEETGDPNPNEMGPDPTEREATRNVGIERYPSLSLYYPESDSEDSSDGDLGDFPADGKWYSPEGTSFTWNEEDREGLIEIALDGNDKRGLGFHVEEENLIEIDISPTRHDELPGEKLIFAGEVRYS
jgi:hypothetical protein